MEKAPPGPLKNDYLIQIFNEKVKENGVLVHHILILMDDFGCTWTEAIQVLKETKGDLTENSSLVGTHSTER